VNQKDVDKIRENITEIFIRFQYEFNTPAVRKQMGNMIGQYLNRNIIDQTSAEMIDRGVYYFCVEINNRYYSLLEYIDNLIMIERRLKIEKIKSRL
jgi:hypothetical protein